MSAAAAVFDVDAPNIAPAPAPTTPRHGRPPKAKGVYNTIFISQYL